MTTEQEWLGNTPRQILAVPAHIAVLPEEEQGPALVQEIHDRKGSSADKQATRPDNRKLFAEMDAKVSAVDQITGVMRP